MIKREYVVHIRTLKQALNHGLILSKLHRVIQFNQESWLKPYIGMNNKLRTEAKMKDCFNLMNDSGFRKTIGKFKKA